MTTYPVPTVPGYYWAKMTPNKPDEWEVVQVDETFVVWAIGGEHSFNLNDFEWGPFIHQPSSVFSKRFRVLKYPIPVDAPLDVPYESTLLHVGEQDGQMFAWYKVPSPVSNLKRRDRIRVIRTGWLCNEDGSKHFMTVFSEPFVWHIFHK